MERAPPKPPAARRQPVLRGGVLLLLAVLGIPGVEADQTRATLFVGASVPPSARLVAALPTHIVVTAHDIDAGFVDAPGSSRLDVHTNARGFILNVRPLAAPFSAVAIAGLEQRVELGSDGGTIVRRVTDASRPVALALRYRFLLSAGAAPGQYAWPLRLDVQPLQ
jgi:hypothetical protein